MSHFRYVYLAASEGGDSKLISEPLALARLALFLIDVNRANKKWSGARARPLLILAERPATYLVVGVNCSEAASDGGKATFAKHFRLAVDNCDARYKHDGFDTATIEIDKADVTRFLQSLHYSMDQQ